MANASIGDDVRFNGNGYPGFQTLTIGDVYKILNIATKYGGGDQYLVRNNNGMDVWIDETAFDHLGLQCSSNCSSCSSSCHTASPQVAKSFDPFSLTFPDDLEFTKERWGKPKCECGGDKVGGGHSNWCPKYKPFRSDGDDR